MAMSGQCTGSWPAWNPGRPVRRPSQDITVARSRAGVGVEKEGRLPGRLRDKSSGLGGSIGYGWKGGDRVEGVYRPPGFWLVWKDRCGSFTKIQNKECCMRTRFEGKDKCEVPVRQPR